MDYATTPEYKRRVAEAILADPALRPTQLVIGNGAYDGQNATLRPPTSALYHQTHAFPLNPITLDGHTLRITGIIPGGSEPIDLDEVGLATADGQLIQHAVFLPEQISTGIAIQFDFDVLPEV